jgi:hypothetical protein
MSDASVIRVAEVGKAAFALRKGEEGLSVFDPHAVEPPLEDEEVLNAFRPGCHLLHRFLSVIVNLGLEVLVVQGAASLPTRLQDAHREIRPEPQMDRAAFQEVAQRT